jgi:hypothetical protein
MLSSNSFTAQGQTEPIWVDEIDHAPGTFFEQKYPASDVALYLNALDRVRGAGGRGEHRTKNIERALSLTMIAHHVQGIDEAAAHQFVSGQKSTAISQSHWEQIP